ncbi:MAG TPA: glutamate racemase [Ignavibacteria bacterium]|nr:glutamate racemase [Ignavibacteria bacterium]HRF66923.1 glutamate racemase [Ignavibacteria bacterium]HRJ05702.1 glutamate racemase [Ignavibacteria bacterium]
MKSNKQDEASRPIGVFDSGVGGLTVVKELNRLLPNERIIYFGDTGRVPYGNKSKETIVHYSLQVAYFLMKKKIKMLVVACNTASSVSLPTLKRHFHIPVIGVIDPGARAAIENTKSNKVGVIGTLGTVRSNAYKKALRKIKSSVNVFQEPCPLFVHLAEDGWNRNKIAQMISDEYLKPMKARKVDTLILGCTHYPLLRDVIKTSVGNKVELIDSGRETAKEVQRILEKKDLLNHHKMNDKNHSVFYVSDFPHKFKEVSQRFLSKELKYVHKVIL